MKFVNAQGLAEAGIDENGVFKEFLEATIKTAFNPQLNLFRATSDNHLYPSNTSGVHENVCARRSGRVLPSPQHLQLFEFVGRMLGKACYEGIVVEAWRRAAVHCITAAGPVCILLPQHAAWSRQHVRRAAIARRGAHQEPAVGEALRRFAARCGSMTGEHGPGDIADLELSFAVDEEQLGQLITVPLLPGGSAKQVTNDNRILYVHLMADYRLNRCAYQPDTAA